MEFMERIKRPVVENVRLTQANGVINEGMLCITAFHCIFSTRMKTEDEITFLHTSTLSLERRPPTTGTNIEVLLKDFRHFFLDFKTQEECSDVIESLEMLSRPGQLDKLHAFFARPRHSSCPSTPPVKLDGLESIFKRFQCPQERWRISSCNKGYSLCSSYPDEVIVPNKIKDEEIAIVAAFRQHGRFPVMCFHHAKNLAVLMRCGQPLCGSSQKRCREDISLLNSCLQSIGKGRILDVRTQQKAQHQVSKGGGVEFPSNYSQWRVEYASLESLSKLQTSYNKLIEACTDSSLLSSSSWFGRLESSGWLSHVERLLKAIKHVVHSIHHDASSVVVHGTTGKDATLQVTSLSVLLMDSHSRTIRGFLELIQREWLDGGHPFSLRHDHVSTSPDKEKSPLFLLFLDALWQILQQYPLSFEFNEILLHHLFVHSYSSSYGTFLYDTPSERQRVKLNEKTESLWDYLLSPAVLPSLLNPLYERNHSVLLISTHPCSIGFWQRLYLRKDLNQTIEVPGLEALANLKKKNNDLKRQLVEIRSELDTLQTEGRQYSTVWH